MNRRTVALQLAIFAVQWALMIAGFAILALVLAPTQLIPASAALDRYLDSVLKAVIAVLMSVFWLFVWDRQVRLLISKREL